MLKKFLTSFLILTVMYVVVSCGSGQTNNENSQADSAKTDSAKAEKKAQNKNNEELIPVEVTTILRGDISDFILLSSNLETEVQADVYARAQGIVEKINVEEGSWVNKDAIMLELEAEEYEIGEKQARVEYDKQLSNFERLKGLYEANLLSDEEFEQAKFTKDAAKYAWEDAKLRLDYMKIRAPISGRVGERTVKVGQRIQPTDKLFSVVNSNEVIAVVYVPEKNINKLRLNQPARISTDNIPDRVFNGWIKRISPVVDPSSGTFKVIVGVRNTGNMLRPGMFVNVHLIIDTHEDTILVPKTSVVYENEYMNVFLVKDSTAQKIRLTPGFEDNEKIESLQDIDEGDKVIVVGQSGLKDKAKVRIVAERETNYIADSSDN